MQMDLKHFKSYNKFPHWQKEIIIIIIIIVYNLRVWLLIFPLLKNPLNNLAVSK